MALLANCHRGPKQKPFKPADFNPTLPVKKQRHLPEKINVATLAQIFAAPKRPHQK